MQLQGNNGNLKKLKPPIGGFNKKSVFDYVQWINLFPIVMNFKV